MKDYSSLFLASKILKSFESVFMVKDHLQKSLFNFELPELN